MSKKSNQSSPDEIRIVDDEEITSVGDSDEVIRLDSPKPQALQKKSAETEDRAMAGMMGEDDLEGDESPRPFDPEGEWLVEAETAEAKVVPMGWFVLLGLALAGVIMWAGYQKLQTAETPVEPAEATSSAPKTVSTMDPTNEFIDSADSGEAEAHFNRMEQVVTDFLKATTIEERLPFIRHRERVEPLMREHYSREEFKSFEFAETLEYNILSLGNHPFLALKIESARGSEHAILIEDTPEGLLVDWESFVCYQPMTLAQLIERRPTEPVSLRFYVKQDTFYAYEFEDESKYQSYNLTTRGQAQTLFGYVERGGLLETKFRKLFSPGLVRVGALHPLILKVRFLPDSRAKRSLIIEGLESRLWAYPLDPSLPNSSQ